MADANPLAAILVAQQRHRIDPLDQQRKYAQLLMQQGSSGEPVRTPIQGAARALQGGVAGLLMGYTDTQQKEKDQANVQDMASLLGAKNQQELQAAVSKLRDPEYAMPLIAQLSATHQTQLRQQQAGQEFDARNTPPPPGTQSAGPQIAGMPLPPPGQGGGVNPNNVGNVRPVGSSTGFQQPATFDDGVRLAVNNAKSYPAAFNQGQPMNLYQIGDKWAPKGDGANDPKQWANNVAQIGGLDPNQPIDLNNPQTAAAFARGVHGAEHGQQALRPPEAYGAAISAQPGFTPTNVGAADVPGARPQMPAGTQLAQGSDLPAQPGQPRADGSGNQVPPPQGAYPAVPRPAPDPELRKKLAAAVSTGAMTPAQADLELEKATREDWMYQRGLSEKEIANQRELTKADRQQAAEGERMAIIDRLKLYNEKVNPAGQQAGASLYNNYRARQLLDAGAQAGPGVEGTQWLRQAAATYLGVGVDTAATTSALMAEIKSRILDRAKALGANPSNYEDKIVAASQGGDMTNSPAAMKMILQLDEELNRRALKNHDYEANTVKNMTFGKGGRSLGEIQGNDSFTIPNVPKDYETFKKDNPLPGAQPPPGAAPPQQGAAVPQGTPGQVVGRTKDGKEVYIGANGQPMVRQ